MMKGYLTVFLSLSLSILAGFILFLTGNAIKNAEKIRLEGAADIGINSVLAEFHIGLLERYDLLYIDASYHQGEPSISNMESRFRYYVRENTNINSNAAPWGIVRPEEMNITEIQSAAAGRGNSMKNQAVCYIRDSGIQREEALVISYLEQVRQLENKDPLEEWSALQEQIAGIELPVILNEQGEWEEVPLGNPADRIFHLTGSDVLYLIGIDTGRIGVGCIRRDDYISGRRIMNEGPYMKKETDEELFLTYLHEKMGNYRVRREDSFLQLQLEYIAKGKESDYENLREVVENLLRWRFADNISYVLTEAGLHRQALSAAESLHAVQLKPELKDPVVKTILYACAYLETIADLKCLMQGGRIPVNKGSCHTGVEAVLSGEITGTAGSGDSGFSYEQYVSCLLYFLDEDTRNLRTMDIMEMDIRSITGNSYFAMDWCIERCSFAVSARGSFGDRYELNRIYGYY